MSNHVAPAPQLLTVQPGPLAAQIADAGAWAQALSFYRIPLFLLPIYQAAAVQYGVPWQILAAINEVETNYGSDLSVSTAGAVGWMQFMPTTWSEYAVDALSAGYADPYNPVDAIFAAARYLRAAGASSSLRSAILAYNHSPEYVNSVLLRAKLISSYPQPVIATLTGLVDARLPVTGTHVAWGLLAPPATARASAPASKTTNGGSAPARPGSSTPPSPAAVAEVATGTGGAAAHGLRLVELRSAPNAAVVAVQDGRIIRLGRSRTLGRYVVLRDVNGDEFTYAGLGSIAPSYRVPKAHCVAAALEKSLAAVGERDREPASKHPVSAGRQVALTLKVRTPAGQRAAAASGECMRWSAGAQAPGPADAVEPVLAGTGDPRRFAHPASPNAIATAAGNAKRPRSLGAGYALPLRRGSVVAQGTVLGRVHVPRGARDGELRFAIQPAGDQSTVDPRPILQSWVQLDAARHPQGASGETDLVGATASGVFVLSKSQLEDAVLSDPGIRLSACGRRNVASGAIDERVLGVLAFLSRSGLKPTVRAPRCDSSQLAAGGSAHEAGDAVDILAIDGIPIAGHQGAGTITDLTLRVLLTLRGEFAPYHIISLMRYAGSSNTLAMPAHWSDIHIGFRPDSAAARGALSATPVVRFRLSTTQWDQLIKRIAELPRPNVALKPSSWAIRDATR